MAGNRLLILIVVICGVCSHNVASNSTRAVEVIRTTPAPLNSTLSVQLDSTTPIPSNSTNSTPTPVLEIVNGLISWTYKIGNELRKPDNIDEIISILQDISAAPTDANTLELFLPIFGKIGNIAKETATSPISKDEKRDMTEGMNKIFKKLGTDSLGYLNFVGNQFILDSYISRINKMFNQLGMSFSKDPKSDAKQFLEILRGIGLELPQKKVWNDPLPANVPTQDRNIPRKKSFNEFFGNLGKATVVTPKSEKNVTNIEDEIMKFTQKLFSGFSFNTNRTIPSIQQNN